MRPGKKQKKNEFQHEFSRFFLSFAETSGIISQQDGMPLKLIGLLGVDNRGRIIGVN